MRSLPVSVRARFEALMWAALQDAGPDSTAVIRWLQAWAEKRGLRYSAFEAKLVEDWTEPDENLPSYPRTRIVRGALRWGRRLP